jgi:hypothetical protein
MGAEKVSMLTPDKMLRVVIEFIFMLLGGLVFWIGYTGHFMYGFNPRSITWMLLGIALMALGARALYQARKFWARTENLVRGLSLFLLGIAVLAISRVPFTWVGPLLAAGGVLLLLRGLAGSVLVFRRS